MEKTLKSLGSQAISIIIASLGAVLIAYLQNSIAGIPPCGLENVSYQEVGFLGGFLKGAHSLVVMSRHIA